ncbi:mechanosensitive ion channel [Arenibacter sp. M-2]|uniref:mechanosensitive ion channel family protein n=1 Tax=Arenibacter sp. M-2 TaxID=3053612 RepID=UPI00257018DC|nr:mechanosensitive ion channel domain-containing protein [Arenibacter sp. M-2]MDL5512422.1 mechanosensitive ion channel [Arenibacter sp. M-2]|tara:strand:- start:19624 stop:20904 length:1281 start_codon:yes stop_codon:yes gene_type:complete
MNNGLRRLLYEYLIQSGLEANTAAYLNALILFVGIILVALVMDYFLWKLLRFLSVRFARQSKTNFDNFLVFNKVPRLVAHIIPLWLLYRYLPLAFLDFENTEGIILKAIEILTIILVLLLIRSLLRSIKDYLKTLPHMKDKPLDSYIQVFMIFAWIGGLLTLFAVLTDTTIWKFFTALGAASAVILLIFKDTILGLVASIQVSINDMVRIGDWITFEKFGADGNVTEISLATVKVQNFDKTITTIPTYSLISDSFKNWRGMEASGGRRIKRALLIKQKSIRFLTSENIETLKSIQIISKYLETRNANIETYNKEHDINKQLAINGRNLTNLGVFRKYVETYLKNHSAINQTMTLMTRQLPPTPQGIPLEIYAFSSDKRWENYEYIMADIFDHLLAALPYFELEVFELPTSFNDVLDKGNSKKQGPQ